MQCNAVQRSREQYSAIQCSAVQCSAVQCNAVKCSEVKCSAVQCNTVQFSAVHYITVHYSAVQCSAVLSTMGVYVVRSRSDGWKVGTRWANGWLLLTSRELGMEIIKHFLCSEQQICKLSKSWLSEVYWPCRIKINQISNLDGQTDRRTEKNGEPLVGRPLLVKTINTKNKQYILCLSIRKKGHPQGPKVCPHTEPYYILLPTVP